MRTRIAVIAAAVGLLLLAGAGAVYAYDRAHAEEIGKGVRVGGVDVSGLTEQEARAKLERAVLDPLRRPVVVRAIGKRFTLTPARAQVGVDVEGSVRAAMERTRSGNMLSRTWRGIRGGSVDAELELDISYSKVAIERLVERVRKAVDKPAVDAEVDLESGDLTPQPSEEGRRVLAKRLQRQVRRRLLALDDVKTVAAKTKLVKTYGIAVGPVGLETPAGLYHIQNKAVDPAWTMPNSSWVAPADRGRVIPGGIAANPLKARWLGIYAGAGIHGTDADGSIGTAASHGCIRMRIPEVIELYDQVPVGAPIYIA
jgi:lipoprotein-anchoring transpeptidase ErfK/SrfK